MPSRTTITNLRIVATVLHSLALVTTGFRATHQWVRGKFLWDDVWALVAVGFDGVLFAFQWVRSSQNDEIRAGGIIPIAVRRATYWIGSITYTCALWAARISIACSILRLVPPGRVKRIVFAVLGYFAVNWAALLFLKAWICGHDKLWVSHCSLGRAVVITKLCSDIISVALLVVIPLYVLWNSTLPKAPLSMLRAVFATSIFTTIISTVHAVYVQSPTDALEGFTAHFESAITVMSCNLLVLVTFFYRQFRKGRDLEHEATVYLTTNPARPSQHQAPEQFSLTDVTPQSQTDFSNRRGSSVFLEHIRTINAATNVVPLETTTLTKPRLDRSCTKSS